MHAAEFSINDAEQFKLRALTLANREPYACYLDSNGLDPQASPQSLSSFECLLGWGTQRVLSANSKSWDALAEFLKTPGWKLGFLSYDLKNETEALSSRNPDPMGFPALCFFVPRNLVIVKNGSVRIESNEIAPEILFDRIMAAAPVEWSPEMPAPVIRQRISREDYLQTVRQIREHILKGDVYEMNFCMDFYATDFSCNPVELFLRLNRQAPAPFASFLKLDSQYILCASPERFLKKTGNKVISQPIKGTAPRSDDPLEDARLKNSLRNSEKEQAENVMIVDLVRNDLSRSALPGTVRVSELFEIHTFRHWHQMISTVEAMVSSETPVSEIIRHAFPMGSMTGAPKVMAMKLIDRYESAKRGAFSGAIGYFTPQGDFDLNVVIRSMLYDKQKRHLSFPVGSAITAGSEPESEYEECLLKAKAIRNLLGGEAENKPDAGPR